MTTNARPRSLPGFSEVPIGLLRPSPTNPRKRFDERELADLAASVREIGILEPLVVRQAELEGYEIVVGERRWRASKIANLEWVPCLVRELTDEQVFDIQIAENNQRADVTPLEEADAIRRGVEDLGRTVGAIASQIGRPAAYVSARLQIAQAPESVRALLEENLVTVGAATMLAKAPPTAVDKVAERTRKDAERKGEPLSRRDVALIVDRFARRIEDAPFALDDAKLTRLNARPCTTCLDRTSAQGALFADAAGDDRCLDAECWDAKLAGLWDRARKDAKKLKLRVLEEPWDGAHTGFFEANRPAYAAGEKEATWASLVEPGEIVIARTEQGRVVELVAPETIDRLRASCESAGAESIPQGSTETDEERDQRIAEQRARRDREDLEHHWTPERARLFERLDASTIGDRAMLEVLSIVLAYPRIHALRLGLIDPGADLGAELAEWRARATARDLAKLLLADALLDERIDDEDTFDGLLPELEEGRAAE